MMRALATLLAIGLLAGCESRADKVEQVARVAHVETISDAVKAGLSSDLKNLAAVEDVWFQDHGEYSSDQSRMGYGTLPVNEVHLLFADRTAWAAEGKSRQTGARCLIYGGRRKPLTELPDDPGSVECTP